MELNQEQQKVVDRVLLEAESDKNYSHREIIIEGILNKDIEILRIIILTRCDFISENLIIFAHYDEIFQACRNTVERLRENLI